MPVDPNWVQQAGSISLLPILHGRMEFSRAVREAIKEISPDVVAVELPQGLEEIFTEAVDRFPCLSFLTLSDLEGGGSEQGAPLWRIEPTDPFCEAVRTARELQIRIVFVDRTSGSYPLGRDRLPDPYAATGVGLGPYYEACRKLLKADPNDPREAHDRERESVMAERLRGLGRQQRVVFVGGMKHIEPIRRRLEQEAPPEAVGVDGSSRPELKLYHPSARTVRTLASDMPFLMTLYELQRGGPGPELTWTSLQPETPEEEEAEEEGPKLDKGSVFGSLERLLGFKVKPETMRQMSKEQLRRLHNYLMGQQEESWSPPSFGEEPSSAVEEGPEPEVDGVGRFFTFRDSEHRREQLLKEYQRLNQTCRTESGGLDRQLVYRGLVKLAGVYYEENTGETFKQWQHQNFNSFSRRYAALHGKLLPGLLPLIYSARACVDHNYAYEFWDLATFYPWQDYERARAGETLPPPLFDFDGEELEIDGVRLRRFEFHRTFPRMRQSYKKVPIRERQAPTDDPNDWSGAFESGRICSYPPEDIVIEDYGRYLQKKAIKVQSDAHSRTEPFTTSLLDGIDMRTTLRNWADGQKLFVREERKISGGTGSVVLIFEEDQHNTKYPWCITWHGEHDQESDMAFYATDRKRKVIGPGIARCEYGGLMLSYPPRRLANVWNDPYYRSAKTKAEVLLFAAIDYCQDKHVLYVSKEAPRSSFFSLAQRLGKKLIYLPIGSLSPTSLERIRVFHVLAGHRYREIAKDFIW